MHLTRHPVPAALSHLAHKSYAGSPRDDAYTRLATLGPGDQGVFAREYLDCWERLSAFEKCLFWWTEVHQYGLELPARLEGVPVLRVKFEAMLAGDSSVLRKLLEFMELPWDERWRELAGRVVDRWQHHTDEQIDPPATARHPRTVKVAHALGYEIDEVDRGALTARYLGTPDAGLDRIGRFDRRVAG